MSQYYESALAPQSFLWRRLHSLMGLFLVIFLIEHLLVNSQASLAYGEDGIGFVHAVNGINNLPYLTVIEILLLAVPFLIHILWGIKYLLTSEQNSYGSDPSQPILGQYARNHAYTWQRITSWILIVGVAAHVGHMRFVNHPNAAKKGTQTYYMIPLTLDAGLYTLSERLGVKLQTSKQIGEEKKLLTAPLADSTKETLAEFLLSMKETFSSSREENGEKQEIASLLKAQKERQQKEWVEALEAWPLQEGEVVAIAPDFGTAELLVIRNTFKNPVMIFLYSLFVLAATYHAFNGLWTFAITWGITVTARSQRYMRLISLLLLFVVGFLGLTSIWGSYLVNLNQ